MPTWLFVTTIFLALIIFLIFIVWLDWKFKCRKTAKENKMTAFVNGYAVVGDDLEESNVYIISGLLGINSAELVFGHRFKDDATYFCQKISDVSGIEILKYDEDTFLSLVRKWCYVHGNTARYVVINMAGISTSKRIPKLVRSRVICKINVNNKSFLFCLKDTDKNIATMNKIKNDISSN